MKILLGLKLFIAALIILGLTIFLQATKIVNLIVNNRESVGVDPMAYKLWNKKAAKT